MSRLTLYPFAFAAALLVAMSPPAAAQRASLADRVATLELRAANTQANMDLLNQIAALRTDVQSLRSQLEELQQANEAMRASGKSQYLDIDSRLERLEAGGHSTGAAAIPPGRPATAAVGAPEPSARKPAPPAPGSAIPTGAELEAYNVAFDALKAGRYAESSALFADFVEKYPGGVYAPNAFYWLGESYYATRNYPLALVQFEQLLDRFPTHDKAPGALLKVGLTRLSLGQADAAHAAFADVVARYPGTDAARSAAERLETMAR